MMQEKFQKTNMKQSSNKPWYSIFSPTAQSRIIKENDEWTRQVREGALKNPDPHGTEKWVREHSN